MSAEPPERGQAPTAPSRAAPQGGEGELLHLIQLLLPHLDDIAYLVRTEAANVVGGQPLFISDRVESLLGWAAGEFLAEPSLWFRLVHPGDVAGLLAQTRQMFARRRGGTREYRLRHKATGEYRWMEDRVFLMEDPAGEVVFQFGVARDITDRKRAEQSLLKLSRVVAQSDDLVLITDAAGVIEYVNPAFERHTGWSLAEARGQTPRILKSGEHAPEFYRRLWETILAGRPFRAELLNRRKNGDRFYEDKTITPIRDDEGRITHFVSTGRDITARKRAEQALLNSEHRFRTLIERSADGVAQLDAQGRVMYCSPLAARLIGRPREQVVGRTCFDFIEAADVPKARRLFGEVVQQGAVHAEEQYRVRDQAGVLHWVEVASSNYLNDPALEAVVVNFREVTARRQAEERLREQARLLDLANDAIIAADLQGRVTFWNQGAERLYGWTRQEMLGAAAKETLCLDEEECAAAFRAVQAAGAWRGELRQRTKDGRELTVDSRWTLLRDEQDQPQSVLAISTDITEKKRLETQFLRSQRLESIGRLASGIAHDLNNVLSPILMSAELIRHEVSEADLAELAQMIQSSAERGAALVRQLTSFGRGTAGAREPVPVRLLVRDLGKLMRETFPKNLTCAVDAPVDLWPVLGDATQLYQVLLNLCVNARDAMPAGGTLSVSAANLRLDETAATAILDAKPGPYVCLRVGDTGMGIAPALLDHIFEPFFTTKEPGKGTGLGLATVAGIVRGHGGVVRVRSTVGQGTEFEVLLPAAPEAVTPPPPTAAGAPPRARGELILVVYDERGLRDTMRLALLAAGYEVVVAEGGAAALALYAEHRGLVRLVVSDCQMPEMGGLELARTLRGLAPTLSIIIASGFIPDQELAQFRALGVSRFVSKPFLPQELLAAVHEELRSCCP